MSRDGSREDDHPSDSDTRESIPTPVGTQPPGATAPSTLPSMPSAEAGDDDELDDDAFDDSTDDSQDIPSVVAVSTDDSQGIPSVVAVNPPGQSGREGRSRNRRGSNDVRDDQVRSVLSGLEDDGASTDNSTSASSRGSSRNDRRRNRGRGSENLPINADERDDLTGINTSAASGDRSRQRGYTFDYVGDQVINLMRVRGSRSRPERIDSNETWRYVDSKLIQEEIKATGTEITIYSAVGPADAGPSVLFTRTSESFEPFPTPANNSTPLA